MDEFSLDNSVVREGHGGLCVSIHHYTFSRETPSWERGLKKKKKSYRKLYDRQSCECLIAFCSTHFPRLNKTLIKRVIKNVRHMIKTATAHEK